MRPYLIYLIIATIVAGIWDDGLPPWHTRRAILTRSLKSCCSHLISTYYFLLCGYQLRLILLVVRKLPLALPSQRNNLICGALRKVPATLGVREVGCEGVIPLSLILFALPALTYLIIAII